MNEQLIKTQILSMALLRIERGITKQKIDAMAFLEFRCAVCGATQNDIKEAHHVLCNMCYSILLDIEQRKIQSEREKAGLILSMAHAVSRQ